MATGDPDAIHDGDLNLDSLDLRRWVHCLGRFPCSGSVRRPVCTRCRATEAVLNGR